MAPYSKSTFFIWTNGKKADDTHETKGSKLIVDR